MKKIIVPLFFLLLLGLSNISFASPYLCGDNGYVYNNQSFCNANCSTTCESLTATTSGSSGTCDTTDYEGFVYNPDTQYTYAITKGSSFWTTHKNNLVIIPSAEVNQLVESLLKYYNISKAWIGCYDPSMSTDYNTVDTSRFIWRDNSGLGYSNWYNGEPNNALPSQDIGVVPTNEQGEHWCAINGSGLWFDEGYHANGASVQTPEYPSVVQWYGKLSCVDGNVPPDTNVSSTVTNMINQYCGGETPCYLCVKECSTPSCPTGYTYNSSNDDCEATPSCPSGGTFNTTNSDCEASIINNCPSGYTYNKTNNDCEDDISPSPSCPDGGTYDSSSGECEIQANKGCPAGYYKNSDTNNLCEDAPAISCADNGVAALNSTTGQYYCKLNPTYTCADSGYTYSSGKCTAEADIVCPAGGSYQSGQCVASVNSDGSCPTGYTLHGGLCTATANITCPGNGTFNSDREDCEESAVAVCPTSDGYTYDNSTNYCTASPLSISCPSPGYYRSDIHTCYADYIYSCDTPYTLVNDTCETNPTYPCPTPGSWNGSYCEASVTSSSCPQGYTMSGNICTAQPTCPSDDISISDGKCITDTVPCETSSSNTAQCTLEDGGDKNTASDYVCPLDRVKCNSSTTTATASPSCPSGGSYSTSLNECVANTSGGDISCPSGGKFDSSLQECVTSKTTKTETKTETTSSSCPSGGSYSSSYKACAATPSGTSCAGGSLVTYCLQISGGKIRYIEEGGYYGSWVSLKGSGTSEGNNDGIQISNGKIRYFEESNYYGSWVSLYGSGESEVTPFQGYTTGVKVYNSGVQMCSASYGYATQVCGSWIPFTATFSCPSGYTYNSAYVECLATPSCPSGYTYNSSSNECEKTVTVTVTSCPSGYTYNSSLNECLALPNSSSTTVESSELCYNNGWKSCSSGGIGIQIKVASRAIKYATYGTLPYVPLWGNRLESSESTIYGGYYGIQVENGKIRWVENNNYGAWISLSSKSLVSSSANNGYYTGGIQVENGKIRYGEIPHGSSTWVYGPWITIPPPLSGCPSGYTYNSSLKECTASASCPSGYTLNTSTDKCTKTVTTYACPLGNYACKSINGVRYCTDLTCQEMTNSAIQVNDNPTDTDKQPNGKVTNGGCEGTVYIFNGHTMGCRPPGLQTGFSNCCKKSKTWFGLGSCKSSEKMLAIQRADGFCHYVGSKCIEKFLHICLQKKKMYCCFHGELARIVQEQARETQGLPIHGWGSADRPKCWGFRPDQFQKIDWSKINLSEYYSYIERVITPRATASVKSNVNNVGNKIKQEF